MTGTEQVIRQRLDEALLTDVGEGFWEVQFRAMGSECELFFAAPNAEDAGAYCAAAFDWLAAFEARNSRFLPDSEISRINANAGLQWTDIAPETDLLLDLCEQSNFLTRGAFDATSLPLSELWDWKRKHDSLPSSEEIAAVRRLIGWHRVLRQPGRVFLPEKGMKLDFGGVGKELAVDCLMQLAGTHGLCQVLIDLGGDIARLPGLA